MVRSAFTLIELIFAIVIIAISVVSLPMMTQTTSKGIEGNILQEAIFAAEAVLNESTSYYWDASSVEDKFAGITEFSRMVNTGNCNGLSPNKALGHINRRCLNNNFTSPLHNANLYALENAHTLYQNKTIFTGTANAASYKDSYSATVNVNLCSVDTCTQFGSEVNNPNLKEVEIIVKNTATNKTVVTLKSYSANIGAVDIESKVF